MADWVKCTDVNGNPMFVNLSGAMSMFWNEKGKYNVIAYPGGDNDSLHVQQNPEILLQTISLSRGE